MTLNISEDLAGKERRRLLELLPLIHALERFKGRGACKKIAVYLGLSPRGLYAKMQKYRRELLTLKLVQKTRFEVLVSRPDFKNTLAYRYASRTERQKIEAAANLSRTVKVNYAASTNTKNHNQTRKMRKLAAVGTINRRQFNVFCFFAAIFL